MERIVVGVDGSAIALRAVQWAAAEARRRRVAPRPLPGFPEVAGHPRGPPGSGKRTPAQAAARGAGGAALSRGPALGAGDRLRRAAPPGGIGLSDSRRRPAAAKATAPTPG